MLAPVEDAHFRFHHLGVLGENVADQVFAVFREAQENNAAVEARQGRNGGRAALSVCRAGECGSGAAHAFDPAHALEAI